MAEHILGFAVALGLAAEPGKKVAEEAVVTFDGKCFGLRLRVLFGWHEVFVGLPIVRHNGSNFLVVYFFPEGSSRRRVP
jgi:hypothetical protein